MCIYKGIYIRKAIKESKEETKNYDPNYKNKESCRRKKNKELWKDNVYNDFEMIEGKQGTEQATIKSMV